MNPVVMVLIGFGTAILTMTILKFYQWTFNYINK